MFSSIALPTSLLSYSVVRGNHRRSLLRSVQESNKLENMYIVGFIALATSLQSHVTQEVSGYCYILRVSNMEGNEEGAGKKSCLSY